MPARTFLARYAESARHCARCAPRNDHRSGHCPGRVFLHAGGLHLVRARRRSDDLSCRLAREPTRSRRATSTGIAASEEPMTQTTAGKRLELIQGLGAWAAMAMVVGHIIGTGVFLVPSSMARATGSVGLIFLVWIAGGLLSLFGALTVAELGAAMPEAGGAYVYLKRGFGPAWGFLFGWMNN